MTIKRSIPLTFSSEEKLVAHAMHNLYAQQHVHWLKELQQCIIDNLVLRGRFGEDVAFIGIHHDGKSYWPKGKAKEDCAMVLCHAKLRDKMAIISGQLTEIENEQHLVKRFLSGLFLFNAPVLTFKQALGLSVVDTIEAPLTKVNTRLDSGGHVNTEQSLKAGQIVSLDSLQNSAGIKHDQTKEVEQYVKENQDVVDIINARLLGQLILKTQLS